MLARILVVEDEPAIQELIAAHLKSAGHIAMAAHDAESAFEMIRQSLPDLILLDWMLPGISGIVFTKTLRKDSRARMIPIIMLTAHGTEQNMMLGLESGVDYFMTKPFSPRELVSRITALLRRWVPTATDGLVRIGALQLDPNSCRVTANGESLALGPTEFRLLYFLMTHLEHVYSRAQLVDNIWGDEVFVDERMVDARMRGVHQLLKPSGLDRLIEAVRGGGYRMIAT